MIERTGTSSISPRYGSASAQRPATGVKPDLSAFRATLTEQIKEKTPLQPPPASARPAIAAARPELEKPAVRRAASQMEQAIQSTQPAEANPVQPMIREVSRIAASAGFVGVTSQDILRAYHSGQSFLADYTV